MEAVNPAPIMEPVESDVAPTQAPVIVGVGLGPVIEGAVPPHAAVVNAATAYTAHREWASRPPDERYASVQALYDAARARRFRTEERTIETVALRTEAK